MKNAKREFNRCTFEEQTVYKNFTMFLRDECIKIATKRMCKNPESKERKFIRKILKCHLYENKKRQMLIDLCEIGF